jgi:hypothetical protein
MTFSSSLPDMATIVQCDVIENGDALAVLVKESDGTISAVRISVQQLAD